MKLETRNRRMAQLYESGLTLDQIGKRYGVTRERVRQILVQDGVGTRGRSAALALRSEQIRQRTLDRRDEVLALYRTCGDVRRTARRLRLSEAHVRDLIDAEVSPQERDDVQRMAASRANVIDREAQRQEMIADLQRAYAEIGGLMTTPRYDDWAIDNGAARAQLVTLRFAGWNKAMGAAELPLSPSRRGGYTRISDEEILDAIRLVRDTVGRHRPTCTDYERVYKMTGCIPSLATVRTRRPWMQWLDALDAD